MIVSSKKDSEILVRVRLRLGEKGDGTPSRNETEKGSRIGPAQAKRQINHLFFPSSLFPIPRFRPSSHDRDRLKQRSRNTLGNADKLALSRKNLDDPSI